jgi:hypothetical protein
MRPYTQSTLFPSYTSGSHTVYLVLFTQRVSLPSPSPSRASDEDEDEDWSLPTSLLHSIMFNDVKEIWMWSG